MLGVARELGREADTRAAGRPMPQQAPERRLSRPLTSDRDGARTTLRHGGADQPTSTVLLGKAETAGHRARPGEHDTTAAQGHRTPVDVVGAAQAGRRRRNAERDQRELLAVCQSVVSAGLPVDLRGMSVGAATTLRGSSPLAASRSRSSAVAAICWNGTRTVVKGTGSRLTTGMSL